MEEMTYAQKFALLDSLMDYLVDAVKKDLRNDHLKKDWAFVKKYFGGKNVNKLSSEELTEGYRQALKQEEKSEELAEFITNRWLFKNSEVYQFFEDKLSKINPNFQEIKEIDLPAAQQIVKDANAQFGPVRTYLFSILNSVSFPPSVFDALSKQAKQEIIDSKKEAEEDAVLQSQASIESHYQEKIARLTDKYEKKLLGMQKKYVIDMDALKKQVALLQRKLSER